MPLGVGQAVIRREHLNCAGFEARPTRLINGLDAIDRCCGVTPGDDGVM